MGSEIQHRDNEAALETTFEESLRAFRRVQMQTDSPEARADGRTACSAFDFTTKDTRKTQDFASTFGCKNPFRARRNISTCHPNGPYIHANLLTAIL